MRNATLTVVVSILLSGCAGVSKAPLPLSPYSVLSEKNPSAHHLVDDFRSQKMQNRVGGTWTASASEGSSVTTQFVLDDALKPTGVSLEMNVRAAKDGEITLVSDLNQLDVSGAKAFSFWLKCDPAWRNAFSVDLADSRGMRVEIPLGSFLKDLPGWQEVLISEELFGLVAPGYLSEFRLHMRASEELSGVFYVDHLVFSGAPNLNLYSLADNLTAFPLTRPLIDTERTAELTKRHHKQFLEGVAEDTWGYFRDLVDERTHLPVDHVKLSEPAHIGDYTSPTNIGLYLLAVVTAEHFGWIARDEATAYIKLTFKTLSGLEAWEGFFYNYYNTTNLQVTNRFVSSVDNAWLAASLVVVRGAFPELHSQATEFLARMNFSRFYSEEVGHFFIGYDGATQSFKNNHYGLISSESRIVSYMAIGKGDVEEDHWFRLYRTLPGDWDWQTQIPKGKEVDLLGRKVFEGYYIYEDLKVVPSWGGSLFEFLMPMLIVDEPKLAKNSLGLNGRRAVEVHMRHAKGRNYPVWGLSPSAFPKDLQGSYGEFGVKAIGAKGYKDDGIVTPHVSFLALAVEPYAALKNIQTFLGTWPMYGPYGFYDSVDVKQNLVCYQYLALDQGMTLVALANYLRGDFIRRYFHQDYVSNKVEPLLVAETFYPSEETIPLPTEELASAPVAADANLPTVALPSPAPESKTPEKTPVVPA